MARRTGATALARATDRAPRIDARDTVVALVIGLLVLVTHDVPYLLHQPYWLDESWVAVSVRVPWHQLALTSATSPLGWTALLRLTPDGGQAARLVPLAFAGAAASLGYLVLRSLGFRRLGSALAGGLVMLVVPALTVRDDLKQYTADAALVLLLVLLLSRLEQAWSRRRLVVVALTVGLSPLLSSAAAFSGSAAFVALALVALGRRDGRRLREVLVAGAAAAVALVGILLATVQHNVGSELRTFWEDQYLSANPWDAWHEIVDRGQLLVHFAGTTSLLLAVCLAALGVVAISRQGRPATALVIPIALAEGAAAGVAHRYPFLDLRTSTWLVVSVTLLMATGVAALVRRVRRTSRPAALVIALVALSAFVNSSRPHLREHSIYQQDVRSQAVYIEAHRRPGDVVLVTLSATWAYAYYASGGTTVHVRRDWSVATGFRVDFPNQQAVLAMTGRGPDAIASAVTAAEGRARPAGGRVWVVRTQVAVEEQPSWAALTSRCGVTELRVGVDPLLLDDPTRTC